RDDSRFTVIQGPHSVKGVSGVTRTCRNASPSLIEIRIRMPQADANTTFRRFCDYFEGAVQLRRDGHYPYVATRSLPQFFKSRERRRLQICRGMHSPASMT